MHPTQLMFTPHAHVLQDHSPQPDGIHFMDLPNTCMCRYPHVSDAQGIAPPAPSYLAYREVLSQPAEDNVPSGHANILVALRKISDLACGPGDSQQDSGELESRSRWHTTEAGCG